MIGNCHYHNYQLIQINHRLQDGVREMKRRPLTVVFNHEQSQVFHNFSLPVLQLVNKALVIMLESEPMFSRSYQMVFEGCFQNNPEKQIVSRISGDRGHRLWLQGPFNLLIRERRANYVAAILLRILEFLSI